MKSGGALDLGRMRRVIAMTRSETMPRTAAQMPRMAVHVDA